MSLNISKMTSNKLSVLKLNSISLAISKMYNIVYDYLLQGNGSTVYVQLPEIIIGDGDWSVEFNFVTSIPSGSTNGGVFGRDDITEDILQLSNSVGNVVLNTGRGTCSAGYTAHLDGEEHLCRVGQDGTTQFIDIDGVRRANKTVSTTGDIQINLFYALGLSGVASQFFDGIIRDLNIQGDLTVNGQSYTELNYPLTFDNQGNVIAEETVVSDGVELIFHPPSTVNSPWVNNGDESYSIGGSQSAFTTLLWTNLFSAPDGKAFKVSLEVSDYVSGSLTLTSGSSSSVPLNVDSDGMYENVFFKTDTNTNFNIGATSDFSGTVFNISIKETTDGLVEGAQDDDYILETEV